MFRLEKVFQNDDAVFIIFSNFIKSIILLITAYTFVILSNHSIYELNDFKIFSISNFFFYSILLSIIYFIFSFFFRDKREYKKNFLSFLMEDICNIIISVIFTFAIIFIFNLNKNSYTFNINIHICYIK